MTKILTQEEFDCLADDWFATRKPSSFVRILCDNTFYNQIIEYGNQAVPFILKRLKEKPEHWFVALNTITGANPVRPPHRGRLKLMAQDWIEWGEQNNFI